MLASHGQCSSAADVKLGARWITWITQTMPAKGNAPAVPIYSKFGRVVARARSHDGLHDVSEHGPITLLSAARKRFTRESDTQLK
jgi:hypothetical protein